MKLIIDFDDVLFDTETFKETFFNFLVRYKIFNARELYEEERKSMRPFSLKSFIDTSLNHPDKEESLDKPAEVSKEAYEEIMDSCTLFSNQNMIALITEVGKQNCFIVTSGDKEFQEDKIVRTGMDTLCEEIYVVPGSKKEVVERLCGRFPSERIIFIDDKGKFFADIDMDICKNLTTVLYTKNSLEYLKAEINESNEKEDHFLFSKEERQDVLLQKKFV